MILQKRRMLKKKIPREILNVKIFLKKNVIEEKLKENLLGVQYTIQLIFCTYLFLNIDI